MLWITPVISALKRLDYHDFEASLGYILSSKPKQVCTTQRNPVKKEDRGRRKGEEERGETTKNSKTKRKMP